MDAQLKHQWSSQDKVVAALIAGFLVITTISALHSGAPSKAKASRSSTTLVAPSSTKAAPATSTTTTKPLPAGLNNDQVCQRVINAAQNSDFQQRGGIPKGHSFNLPGRGALNSVLDATKPSSRVTQPLSVLMTVAHRDAFATGSGDISSGDAAWGRTILDANAIWAWCATNISGVSPTTTTTLPNGGQSAQIGSMLTEDGVELIASGPISVPSKARRFVSPLDSSKSAQLFDLTIHNTRSEDLQISLGDALVPMGTDQGYGDVMPVQETCHNYLRAFTHRGKKLIIPPLYINTVVPPGGTIQVCVTSEVSARAKTQSLRFVESESHPAWLMWNVPN